MIVGMYLIVGLGNPGSEYELTRHNVGRIVLKESLGLADLRLGRVAGADVDGAQFEVLFPDTYMNESGGAVRRALNSADSTKLVVVYDDIDLPLGEFKLSFGRGAGGHNGLSSIIAALDTKDSTRVRIGIGRRNFWGRLVRPQGEELSEYVLGRFSSRELAKIKELSGPIRDALKMIVTSGIEKAMNEYN